MAIPDYQTIMKPLLEFLKKHPGPQRMQDVIEALSSYFSLSETHMYANNFMNDNSSSIKLEFYYKFVNSSAQLLLQD